MRRQLVPGPVVRLTVIKAKTRPGIEASVKVATIPGRLGKTIEGAGVEASVKAANNCWRTDYL